MNSTDDQDTLRILSFYYDIAGSLESFDCLTSNTLLSSIVFDSLVQYSSDTGEIVPSLAESWVVSLDSRHWTFYLRNDVLFHDGSLFTAQAVKFSYDRIIDPLHPAYVDAFDLVHRIQGTPLESVEVVSPFIVRFHFSEPYAPFLYDEAPLIGIYSPSTFNESGVLIDPIGTGPYRLVHSNYELTNFTFSRNLDYHLGAPPFASLVYRNLQWFDVYEEAILNHEGDLGYEGLEIPDNDPYWTLLSASKTSQVFYYGYFNISNAYLANPQVRTAINYAIDKEFYKNQVITFRSDPNSGNITSLLYAASPFYDESVPGYPYDLDLANTLLDKAGYPRGSDGYRFSLILSGGVYKDATYNYTADQLARIGIKTTATYIEWENATRGEGLFDIYLWGKWGVLDPSYLYNYLHTSGLLNLGGFSDPRVDLFLQKGQQTPIDQERAFYYSQVQWLSQELAPYLLLGEVSKVYPRANTVADLVKIGINGKLRFSFSKSHEVSVFSMQEVSVPEDPLYFQLADLVVTPPTGTLDSMITLSLARDVRFLLPEQELPGKFYRLSNKNPVPQEFVVRFYFDKTDFDPDFRFEKIQVYTWDDLSNKWSVTESTSFNSSFRFIEVPLVLSTDPVILGFNFDITLYRTFQYLLPFLMLIGTFISLGTAIIILNRIFSNNLKEEFLLP